MSFQGRTYFAIITILLFSACSRRPSDEAIANQIKARYFSDPMVKAAVLSVTVKDGRVTLSGSVPDSDVHLRAFQLAFATPGVAAIDDRIAVARREPALPPAPVLAQARAAAQPPKAESEPVDPPAAEPPPAQPEPPPPVQAPRPPDLRIRRAPVQVHVTSLPQPAIPVPPDNPAPDVVDTVQPAVVLIEAPAPPSPYRAPRHLMRAVALEAAGAPLGDEVYSRWFAGFMQWQPNVSVHNPGLVGLGAAVKLMREHALDLGFGDMPLTDHDEADLSGPLHVPVLLDAVIVSYNLPGLDQPVNFTAQALAGIYLGTITRWDDRALTDANPRLTLPAAEIVPIHRTDSSGVTYAWTDYLSHVSPDWRTSVGATRAATWPVGIGAAQDGGVAGLVRQTPYSIGYLNMAYAIQNRILMGRVRNTARDLVLPTPATLSAAAISPYTVSADGRASIVNSPARMAYPIALYHWFILPAGQSDRVKKDAVAALVEWSLTAGQGVDLHGYVPIPQAIAASAIQQLRREH